MKRLFDLVLSIGALILLSPVLVLASCWIVLDDGLPVFFVQERVGKNGKVFGLLKFRSMRKLRAGETELQITVGRNPRITRVGHFLRSYKLDELPQLLNIFLGSMSFVGPRPEVPKYVALYNEEQKKVLSVSPGLTDYASIKYRNENELLAECEDPERMYIEQIMPDKLSINLEYVRNHTFFGDLAIILNTVKAVFKNK